MILAGDHIYKMDYGAMIDFHRERSADLTVGVVEVEKSIAGHLGVVEVDKKGRVRDFRKNPGPPDYPV